MLKRFWYEDEGVLTFEWILLLTILVIGVIGGVAAIRDALNHEAQGAVGAVMGLDQGYFVQPPLGVSVSALHDGACSSSTAAYSAAVDYDTWSDGRVTVGDIAGSSQVKHLPPNTTLCTVQAN
jgi:Flp pilus assembly pilin Flp